VGEIAAAELRSWLETALTRVDDRALFGFDRGITGGAGAQAT
jgi:hypothetical protein